MTVEDNSHAGQGPVLLDIGGDIGALIVVMPSAMEGVEVEIRPLGYQAPLHTHDAGHDHGHDHDHPHLPHVAVVARPVNGEMVHSLVYGELIEGTYELYEMPAGPVQLTVQIVGGTVTEARWPV